ncbi:hypothetical protein JVU11DRAFT_8332 [Chiua virens]|nr:hypothetical protein JVU11DRAFT_8332 [Chiua virens]
MAEWISYPPFNPDSFLGSLLVGGLVAAAVWGVTSSQTYIYYQRYPKDSLTLKLIASSRSRPIVLYVANHTLRLRIANRWRFLWMLGTFDVCLTSHVLYHYLVINYLNPIAVVTPVWSLFLHIAVTSVTDVVVRS